MTAEIDLRIVGMVFEQNGEVMATATGAEALGNPAEPLAWLVNKMPRYGITRKKGEFEMSGGLTKALEVKPESYFKVTFDRLGSFSAMFKQGERIRTPVPHSGNILFACEVTGSLAL